MEKIGNDEGFEFDPKYEFSAPHFFDFIEGETQEKAKEAELWFKTALTYTASPYVAKIKSRQRFAVETLCSFEEAGQLLDRVSPEKPKEEPTVASSLDKLFPTGSSRNCDDNKDGERTGMPQDSKLSTQVMQDGTRGNANEGSSCSNEETLIKTQSHKSNQLHSTSCEEKQIRSTKEAIVRCVQDRTTKERFVENNVVQATKRRKLEGGRLCQISNIKECFLPHKVPSNYAATKDCSTAKKQKNLVSAEENIGGHKEISDSKIERLASPFVSVAEKVKRFQTKTPERFHYQPISSDCSVAAFPEKPKPKLTRPKPPELETAQRVRPIRVKSSAMIEEEMLAKIPKFKALPLNKKILEAPSLPLLQKRAPQLPQFQEFHLKTMERAIQHSGASSLVSSTDSVVIPEKQQCKSGPGVSFTEPRPPHLETALRARPPKVKTSVELLQEELEKVPKFKARPLNKKIFCSRGDLGILHIHKRQVTTPTEFHFATNERIHKPSPPVELFRKLSLNSKHPDPGPQPTRIQPFHLLTEDRGAEKEKRFELLLLENERREQEARIPKANPLPYTTDCPVIPPKPEPKECTKAEPFELESLLRHEEQQQRMIQQQERRKREEAEMRTFRAQPIMCNGPVHIPERVRMPLTEVHEFRFRIDSRAIERTEFDKKVMEKHNMHMKFREEYEAAQRAEEAVNVKNLRKAMVPQARPMPLFDRPFVPQRSSRELTRPQSPKLRVLHRKDQRQSLTSSVQKQSQMR